MNVLSLCGAVWHAISLKKKCVILSLLLYLSTHAEAFKTEMRVRRDAVSMKCCLLSQSL